MKLGGWNRVTVAFYLVLATSIARDVHAADLSRKEIVSARARRAVCNDFSNAAYYVRHGSPRHWVVFFEGGGGCSTFSDCNQRYLNYPEQMSSPTASSITGGDILSTSRDKNPVFHDYTHILVPYCSSDAWLGNRTLERFEDNMGFAFNYSDVENSNNFVYAGQVILRAVIEDLGNSGLINATDLVLVGSSAGGIGLLNNLEWIKSTVSVTNTRVVLDSSWFIGYTGHHVLQFNVQVEESLNFAPKACQDLSLGYPCCVSPACLFSKGYLDSADTPILAISSLYDIFTLEQPLRRVIETQGQDDQALLALFNGYGSIMNETLIQSHSAYPQLSVYAPSCSQHVYLTPSVELRGSTQNEYRESLFTLTNPIEEGNWERVSVDTETGGSVSLLEALEEWASNSSSKQFFLTDACRGPACGVCPSTISITPDVNLWSPTWNYTVLVLSGLMTLFAALIKTSAYLYMKYLLLQQRHYCLNSSRTARNRSFPKPTHAVNVSCTDLSHHVELVRGRRREGGGQNRDTTDTPKLDSSGDCHATTTTKMERVVPCYKQLCSKWHTERILKEGSSNATTTSTTTKSNNNQSEVIHSVGLRPDSGISSTENLLVKISKRPKVVATEEEETMAAGESSSNCGSTDLDTESVNTFSNEGGGDPPMIRKHRKTILMQVNMYINPGELVAIMGPSGSGKTTLLDVLLNKRTTGITDGEILINGTPISKMRQWFVGNTGYVRQLATYYYNELTVRENLLFSMNMQAMRGMSLRQKLERVEQVIREMGLQEQGDVPVGDSLNGGLSGGQRKRLAIAVQLLSVPNILFLDEPTSGLDSATSLEILTSLSMLAETGRSVVVTIHQPRSEIFHSFDKILLLCRGQVAYFGSPVKVWDFFTHALDYEDESLSEAGCSTNTADRILDLLKEPDKQQQVLRKYRGCGEPSKVQCAVRRGRGSVEPTPLPLDSRNPGFWHRLVSLEARASLRQTTFTTIYLPIVYLVFGTILGTTYLYTSTPVQVMSVTCLLSCSSSLFMSSIVMSLLVEPLKLFRLENSDGISSAHELILQVFVRMSTICTLPLAACATLVFMLVYQNYTVMVYVIVLLTFLLVNQCWLSLFILFTVLYPQQAHRLCPVFSAIGGFSCGFIIPKPLMPAYYRWIFYINPSYYAYAGTTVTVLHDNDLGCSRESPLECFRESSVATLSTFGLEDINPIQYMAVLIVMVWVLLVMAVAILQLKVTWPVIKESLQPLFCCLAKGRKRHRQVHSTEALGLVEHNPTTCFLHSSTATTGSHPPLKYDSVIDLEGVDSKLESTTANGSVCTCSAVQPGPSNQDKAVSTKFLPEQKHKVEFDFPWERQRNMVVGEDPFEAPPTVHEPSSPVREVSQETTTETEEGGEEGGSVPSSPLRVVWRRRASVVGSISNRFRDGVVHLTMEEGGDGDGEDGIDEGTRREMMNEKWKQRRHLMDTELRRLKHNEDRARRYSGAFVHQALERPQEDRVRQQRRKNLSSSANLDSARDRAMYSVASVQLQHQPQQRKPLRKTKRSKSMLVRTEERVGGIWSTFKNPLFPHEEVTNEDKEDSEEEEEEEEERERERRERGEGRAGLGLPPKDVPFYEKNVMSVLDMSQIPMEEITIVDRVHSHTTSDHWNTAAGQDDSFHN